jgi:protein-S-isoprenylcysteine O-methyltransferase Ste14
MFARALLAFIALPGMVAIVAPPAIASLDPWRGERWTAGAVVLLAGAVVLLWCVRDFYVSGKGTLAPWDPPRRLVVVGLYRFTRNPMYVGVLVMLCGWALYLRSPLLVAYTVALAAAFHARVVTYEEPWCASQFGAHWQAYAAAVPRWLPRRRPWYGEARHDLEAGAPRPGA